MDNKIKYQLKINKVREMKNPTILMNTIDFDTFKNELESKGQNLKIGENLTYRGVPVKTNDIVEKGNILVYDDVSNNWQ